MFPFSEERNLIDLFLKGNDGQLAGLPTITQERGYLHLIQEVWKSKYSSLGQFISLSYLFFFLTEIHIIIFV